MTSEPRPTPVPLVVASGQVWKLYCALAIMIAAGVVMVLSAGSAGRFGISGVGMLDTLGSALIVLGALAWLAWSVRCPSCGAKLVWLSLRQASAGESLTKVFEAVSCPRCGHRADR